MIRYGVLISFKVPQINIYLRCIFLDKFVNTDHSVQMISKSTIVIALNAISSLTSGTRIHVTEFKETLVATQNLTETYIEVIV